MARAIPMGRPPVVGPPRATAMWLWFGVSGGIHVALLLGWSLWASGVGRGGGPPAGFLGTSVELEVAGPEKGPPRAATPAGRAREESAPSGAPRAREESVLQGELPVRAESSPAQAQNEGVARRPSPPRRNMRQRGDPREADVSAPGPSATASGTDAQDSTAGDPGRLILGSAGAVGNSVTAQRALIPNAGMCEDPVVGTWRTQKYRADERSWVRFTLTVRRSGDQLTGTILSRIWTGPPSDPNPGHCTAFGYDHTWRMSAQGHIDGESVTFRGTNLRLIRSDCPSSDNRYAIDNFSGRVDGMRDVFQSLNNDGAFDINEPYTFRRISCE